MSQPKYPLLNTIDNPLDLKKLSLGQLSQVCREVREFIIDEVSANPGHFGASLGTVELAVALHYIYNTPYDKLVWDVGHQAYAHKILTGRREQFANNRKYGGISGFPSIAESDYDAFGTGHSSTSISSALGIAIAAQLNGENRNVVAVIGDGSMSGGLAFEGLNNAGMEKANLLVILNDNNISIDPNVGALSNYLTQMTLSRAYNKMKDEVWFFTGRFLATRRFFQKIGIAIKSALLRRSNLFESLGFRYFGAVDGHNVEQLVQALSRLKKIPGPKLLHIITQKGKGYKPAEENQTLWHAPGTFDRETGKRSVTANTTKQRYQDVFGETVLELAQSNDKIVAITPAMPTGCSLNIMMKEMPERTFDVGIAEQHAVTFSAGLAVAGRIPFCNIYSSFMQRAYDSVIHDVALQNLHVVFCLDRGGLVGEDGATHHGVYDLAYLRCVPNIIVAAPMNEVELRNMLYTAQLPIQQPFSIRYPRGTGIGLEWKKNFEEIPIGKSRQLSNGEDIAILTIGHVGNFALQALKMLQGESIFAAHYDMRFLKPIDELVLHEVGKKYSNVVTVEDGTVVGGLGSAVSEFFAEHGYTAKIHRLGVPDKFVEHGDVKQLQKDCGFDTDGIYCCIKQLLKK
ncbi:MAG: 1-deoxy-D-xylulose-5-phosphate synthase [Bacteroidales bacterium]